MLLLAIAQTASLANDDRVSGPSMPNITPFLEGECFDDEALLRMSEAYDKAQQLLHDRGQPSIVRELIAKAIIKVAATGERDADELAQRGLRSLGIGVDKVA